MEVDSVGAEQRAVRAWTDIWWATIPYLSDDTSDFSEYEEEEDGHLDRRMSSQLEPHVEPGNLKRRQMRTMTTLMARHDM